LPLEDFKEFSCNEEDVLGPSTSEPLRHVIRKECGRVRELLSSGPPLAASLPFRARFAVAGFVAGGLAAVDSIEQADYDVLAVRCRPSKRGVAEGIVRILATTTAQRDAT